MTKRRALLLGAFASIALLAAGGNARADYSFSTTSGGTIPFDGPTNNLILTGQPASQVLNFTNSINIQDVEIASATAPPNLISSTVPFSFTLNIVQTPGFQPSTPGSGSVLVSGSLLITRSDVGGEISSLVSMTVPSLTIGNTTYTFSTPSYAPPVVNSAPNSVGAGNLSILITPTIVPEPASLAMMGTGLAGILGLGLRRSRKATV